MSRKCGVCYSTDVSIRKESDTSFAAHCEDCYTTTFGRTEKKALNKLKKGKASCLEVN